MNQTENVVGFLEEGCGRKGFCKCPCELCCSPGVCVGEAAEVWSRNLLFVSEKGGVVDVNPKGAMVAWRVGEGGVSCCSDPESWGDVGPVNNFRAPMVYGWGFLSAVVGADGRDEAQLTKASVYFSFGEIVVGVHAYDEAVPLVPPGVEALEVVSAEGGV